jgi:ferritin-like metal-binding protein YciE
VIISAAIKVEHFEIASYRGLITGAEQMGQQEVVNLLQQNLQEEEETARIAEQSAPDLIQKAMTGQQQEEEKGLIDKARDKLTGQ